MMPETQIDDLETASAGWIDQCLESTSRWIDSQLRKRYAVPFTTFPETVCNWLALIVTVRCYLKIGIRPTDESFSVIKEEADKAREEIKAAADAKDGLWDLPVVDAKDASAVSKGFPLVYAEASHYTWTDRQGDQMRSNGER